MKIKALALSTTLLLISFFTLTTSVSAQFTTCDFFPCSETQEESSDLGGDVNTTLEELAGTVVSFIFLGIILYGIFLVVKGALEMIRSGSNAEKFTKGYSLIRTVFIGIALIFVGIIGLVAISVLFDVTTIFNQQVSDPTGTIPLL